jgi:hypothetical protein
VARDDPSTDRERDSLLLAGQLIADAGNGPIITSLRDRCHGPERVRDALTLLAELDPDLIVQVALDALIHAHATTPPPLDQAAGSQQTLQS